jgi:predicted amidohydrolase YtcJ
MATEPDSTRRPAADTALYNGKIHTVDQDHSVVTALALRDGQIQKTGETAHIRDLAGPGTAELDLGGRTVIPGLIDSHVHVRQVGLDLQRVTLFDATTIDEVLAAIENRATETPDGEWVQAGWGWHESQLEETRLPTRTELDTVAPDNPVYIPRGGHVAVLNSLGLAQAGIDDDTDAPAGGTIVRDPNSGKPNGVVLEAAREELVEPALPERGFDGYRTDIQRAMEELNSRGVTAALEPGLEQDELRAFMDLQSHGESTLRVDALLWVDTLDDVEKSAYFSRGFGNDMLKVGGVKFMLDGGVEGAKLLEPYNVVDGVQEQEGYDGHYLLPPGGEDELRAMAKRAAELGHQLQTHAVGDQALDLLVDIYAEAADVRSLEELRWTLMHVFLPTDKTLDRAEELGVHCTVQHHPSYLGQNMLDLWGDQRAADAIPLARLADRDFVVGGGTDAPVVPWYPFQSLEWMVTRETVTAGTLGPEQSVSREQALEWWTRDAAYTMHWEDTLGSLEEGKRADLAVLDTDYFSCPAEEISEINVDLTMVDGEIVYENSDAVSESSEV